MSPARFVSLAITLALTAPAIATTDVDPSEVVTRLYSLDSVLPPAIDNEIKALAIPTTPLDGVAPAGSYSEECDQRFTKERIIDLLTRIVAVDEWQLPGHGLTIDDSGPSTLIVTASPQAQIEVDRFLEFLASHFRRQVRVRTEMYSIAATPGKLAAPSGDLRTWIEAHVSSGALTLSSASTVGLISGTPHLSSRIRSRSIVRHYDVEIATRSTTPALNMSIVEIGDRLLMRADCGPGDRVELRFAAHRAEELREMRRVDTVISSTLATNDHLVESNREATCEAPQIGFATLGGSLALSLNQPRICYVAPSGSDEMDRVGMLIVFTLESLSPAKHSFESGQQTLRLFDTAALVASAYSIPQHSLLSRAQEILQTEVSGGQSMVAFGLAKTAQSVLRTLELVTGAIDGSLEPGGLNECVNGFVFLTGEHSATIERRLIDAHSQRESSTIRGELDANAQQNGRIPLFEVPVGEMPSIAFTGFGETLLANVFSDVANDSAVMRSVSAPLITGRFWQFGGSSRGPSANVSIHLDQRLRRGEPSIVTDKAGSNARLERVDFDDCSFVDRLPAGRDSESYSGAFSLLEGPPSASKLTTRNLVIERVKSR